MLENYISFSFHLAIMCYFCWSIIYNSDMNAGGCNTTKFGNILLQGTAKVQYKLILMQDIFSPELQVVVPVSFYYFFYFVVSVGVITV